VAKFIIEKTNGIKHSTFFLERHAALEVEFVRPRTGAVTTSLT
jgi:hypothetical protein